LETQGISAHPVIRFKIGSDSLFFDAETDLDLKPGTPIPIRFQTNEPKDGKIDTFYGIWIDTIIYCLFPVLIVLALYATPKKFDPIVPPDSAVVIGTRPFIRIVPQPEDSIKA